MIKVRDSVPSVYYNESRDFQAIGRSFEAVFNYLKTNVDLVGENPLNRRSSYQMIKLVTKTLGFESRHEYDIEDLRTVASIFTECLRKKGSFESINLAIKALLHAQHISDNYLVSPIDYKKLKEADYKLKIVLPISVVDVVLLEDLFDYILPAGITYDIVYGDVSTDNVYTSIFGITDSVNWKEFTDNNTSNVSDFTDVSKSSFDTLDDTSKLSQTYTGLVVGIDSEEEE